ncbi:39S ribosomal protein L12, mitochondrial [Trichinella sp. T6]|nr:39S ribosomal protein L12, mitochondrial [Trichinella sp. T6]KRX80724.1 39S ribosomal protein L12, mitochondrial [Trichinella sp. T6]
MLTKTLLKYNFRGNSLLLQYCWSPRSPSSTAAEVHESKDSVFKENHQPFPPPAVANEPCNASPVVTELVEKIANLSLLEVSDLNRLLRKRLNLPDTPTVFPGMGMFSPAGDIGEAKKDEKKDVQQKTSFTLRLVKFDESKKIALIKEIKNVVPGLNLVQAKKYVETLPQIVKEDIGQTEAEKLKEQITAAGGECSADVLHTPTDGSSFGQEVPRRPMTIFFSRYLNGNTIGFLQYRPFNVTQHFLHPSQSESFEQRKSSSSGRLFGEGHFPGFS